ncbi:MAG: hypothetical protein KDA78_17350, partial [Planctomycetaceae bacterium]|nr:hypothetical protein [Planctomycetaceae bacterium]
MVPSLILISLGLALFLTSLTFHSLREFSRSKLETICKTRRNETRLGEILKQDQNASLATETWYLLALLGLGVATVELLPQKQHQFLMLAVAFVAGFVLPRAMALIVAENYIFYTWPIVKFA